MHFNTAVFETACGLLQQLPPSSCPEIVFSGRSNVGKSSLINKTLQRKAIARVSATPGKTVTINFFKLDNIKFVALPGFGFANVAKHHTRRWSSLVEGYFSTGRMIDLVVQLVDFRHSPTQDDINMINYLIENEFPFIIALTKADKLSKTQRARRRQELLEEIPYADQIHMIEFSSETGEGVTQLQQIIEDISAGFAEE